MRKFLLILSVVGLLVTMVPSSYAAKSFIVLRSGSDQLLISDGFSDYVIELGWGCSTWSIYEGQTIYIDTFYSPLWGDTVIIPGGYSDSTCEVFGSESVDIKRYYVTNELSSSDEIIVEDSYGEKYLVEYGIGCLSMWRYENKYIDIDVGGAFLDGIGDRIYLFDSDDDCKVWDAESLNSGGGGYYPLSTLPPLPTQLSCPINSYVNGDKCTCNTGYVANTAKDACVRAATPTPISSPTPLTCVAGFLPIGGACISHTQDCINNYGSNVYGVKGPENNSNCYCNGGYDWNSSQTICIKTTPTPTPYSTPTPTYVPEQKSSSSDPVECDNGFSLSLDGLRCIRLPENSHSVDNGDDVWLCDEGFEEVGNFCVVNTIFAEEASVNIEAPLAQEPEEATFSKFIIRVLKFWEWFD